MSKVPPLAHRVKRHLDWDIETIAAGFADPQWVPQKITVVAWSWVGSDDVEYRICTPAGLFGKPQLRRKMLVPLLEALREADVWTGHNLLRFDIPVLQAECLRLGLPSLPSREVQDTIRIVRSKGFKKGQDNIGQLLKLPLDKLPLSWQQWQDAYDEKGWPTIIERCVGDIQQHKLMRTAMIERRWLRPNVVWKP